MESSAPIPFGNSTHGLVFRNRVRIEFDPHGQTPGLHAKPIHANARIARVLK